MPRWNVHKMRAVSPCVVVLAMCACGGGSTPSVLSAPRVTVAVSQPNKELLYQNPQLNLIKRLSQLPDRRLLVVGNELMCTLERDRRVATCTRLPVDLWDLDVLTDAQGNPAAVVGSGGWGKPSAVVVDATGVLRWRFDGGFQVMDSPVVAGSAEHGLVLVGDHRFDIATGKEVQSALCKCGAIGSADFDDDGKLDLVQLANHELRIVDSEGHERSRRTVDSGLDPGFVFTTTGRDPFVLLSGTGRMTVYDRTLASRRTLQTPSDMPALQPVAAAFIDGRADGALAVLVKGRGGWRRSVLYVFSAENEIIYAEVLADDYGSLLTLAAADAERTFLIGGRGQVWSYRFPAL